MVHTPASVGREIFGPDYRDIVDLNELHTEYTVGGIRGYCNHMHDGTGFANQHNGITIMLERALQAVNPRVTVPYWDYTKELHDANKFHDGDRARIFDSITFDPNWFGNVDEVTRTFTEGRWKGMKVPETRLKKGVRNSYGLMRSPWNNNPNPYVQRFPTLAGAPATYSWPTCESHYTLVNEHHTSFTDFQIYSSHSPHAPVHSAIGGHINAEAGMDIIAEFTPPEMVDSMRDFASHFWKDFYLKGLLTCPATCAHDVPYEECSCTCGEEATLRKRLDDPEYFEKFILAITDRDNNVNTGVLPSFWGLKEKQELIYQVCTSKLILGEQYDSTSPVDLIFWVIHPTIDRLTQWFQLNKGFDDPTWVRSSEVWFRDLDYCWGHSPYDVLPWALKSYKGVSEAKLSNLEWYSATNPGASGDYAMPYVYDEFQWDHCEEEGFAMHDI
eukprot:CAMPEP_0113939916 /NCGR_PEP_ID=MMETSP1339-20121228/6138_1 /TAXON_ID=94617 /ORGANISM="Fibrocapsa japonica" /LENGTH=442 /DNA_ID=CAMNT_0000943559 /DNA_START=87 /DNA_END=1415 /DNA_ORIENTATION=+ /assembly_acc=CAM_ASM_000762